jgi:adenylate cyclase
VSGGSVGSTLRLLSVASLSESDGRGLHERKVRKKLHLLAVISAAGTAAGLAVNFAQGRTSPSSMIVGIVYGLLMSVAIGGVELFILDGPMRFWLSGLPFTANLVVRSTIYAAIMMIIRFSQSGEVIARLPLETSRQYFWMGFIYSAAR